MTQPWIARAFGAKDEPFVRSFRCATTRLAWDVEVESWVQGESVRWVTDPTYAAMDRRLLVMLDPRGTLAGVVAHELMDAIQPGTGESFFVRIVTGIAVSAPWQGKSIPRNGRVSDVLMSTVLADITARPPAVPFVSALIHVDNVRSSALFTRHEFDAYPPPVDGYVRHTLANP